MSPERKSFRGRSVVAVAVAVAVVGLVALAGSSLARTFTLREAKGATVITQGKTTHENIVVNSAGQAVYWLSGDSKRHPECTKSNGCFSFWPPVKVAPKSSLSKGPGVSGTLGTWKRNGLLQVTLSGHPLYTYLGDTTKNQATGQGVKSFGGTWFVEKAASSSTGSTGGGW